MNRSEALAPLNKGEARMPIEAGALIRGHIRRALLSLMLDYYEEKGWFESTFIVRGDIARVMAFRKYLKHLEDLG